MKIKKFNMHEQGLNHFFGPLEARIMDITWATVLQGFELHMFSKTAFL